MNPVSWFEIACQDLERAKSFYEKVFGLDMRHLQMPQSEMYMMMGNPDAKGSMGALISGQNPSKEGTLIYFEVQDMNTTLKKIEAEKVQILFPKTAIGEFGFISHFIDSEGNRIGLHSHS